MDGTLGSQPGFRPPYNTRSNWLTWVYYCLLGTRDVDQGHILENIVFLGLLRRGYQVRVGKVGFAEADFVAQAAQNTIGSPWRWRDRAALKRELAPLDSFSDHNLKYLLVTDKDPPASHNGIRQKYVLNWYAVICLPGSL